jgi:hypothetical protein
VSPKRHALIAIAMLAITTALLIVAPFALLVVLGGVGLCASLITIAGWYER